MEQYIIYKIVCKDINITDCYVGSTNNFNRRKGQHKSSCNNPNDKNYNLKIYQIIRATNGWENFNMIEIEKYNCNNKNEACKRERYWLETLKANLNMVIPTRTNKEYEEYRKEKMQIYQAEYRNKHRIIKIKKINNEIEMLEIDKLIIELEQLELEFIELLK